ncbi:MAG: hypothetical protein MASP_00282 [Candidatus Methanolliviera sp. GoM_asphalt]|nr:MAG: hypothetical protein MASP_00282 [Candidatus Methanolliviera sp. GoM_asphalt]
MRRREKWILLGIVLAALLLPINLSSAQVAVTDYKTNPQSFMSGDHGLLEVNIGNTGGGGLFSRRGAEVEKVYLESDEIECDQGYSNLGELSSEGMKLSFPIGVPKGLKDGTYFLKLCIIVRGGDEIKFPIPIEIDNSTVEILEKDIPESVSLKGSEEIKLLVVNNRPNPIYSVRVKPVGKFDFMPKEILLSSTTIEEEGLEKEKKSEGLLSQFEDLSKQYSEMLGGAKKEEKIIGLGPHESREITFSVAPRTKGEQEIEFIVQYKNGGNLHEEIFKKTVKAEDKEEVRIVFVEHPEPVPPGEEAKIEMEVINGRSGKIDAVSVIPTTKDAFPSEAFIGAMEPNDAFPISFKIDTDNLKEGTEKIGFKVRYKSGENYYESRDYTIDLNLLPAQTEVGYGYSLIPIFLIIFVVLGILMRRRK